MSYVLGFFYADGTMIDDKVSRGKYVRFINTDRDILNGIRDALGSKHNIYATKMPWPRKTKYVLSIGNKQLYKGLSNMGLVPNKSLVVTIPSIPPQYIHDFVRGYFDGDGCIHVEKTKKLLRVIFTSGSFAFLIGLAEIISSANNIKIKKVYSSRRAFQLRYNQNDSLKILSSIYKNAKPGLYLERKNKIFENFKKTRM